MSTRLIASEPLTAALARMLAADLAPGATVLLEGPVGAGKTHFARAFIRARQGDLAEDVPSPTFTLVQTYDDPRGSQIWHADLYRLTDPSELSELGLDEAMDEAICLIEWPDRLTAPPPGALTVTLSPCPDPDLRGIELDFPGAARLAARAGFVTQAGWDEARVLPLAGDASARRYFRLEGPGGTAVLMDDASGAVAPFVAMTDWLRDRGFGAPALLAQDAAQGLLLLQDLGDDLVARVLARQPDLAPVIQDRITDLLVDLHRQPVPGFVAPLDGAAMADLVRLFTQKYPGAAAAPRIPALIAELHDRLCRDLPPALSLRDFHAENLVWRDAAPLGLLDYQDAVAAHPAYDLVSCLQDARRDVDPAVEQAQIARYLAATGADEAAFRAAYALIGAQRALRILGIFVRLAVRDGKPRYLDFMPRVWGHLSRNLAHPALAPLADALAGLPAPDAATRERIHARCRP
ncbi:tRNA (adenosine(37)-N6)-threonylcarbamoyltransferase complex ATPase subunit type 1 TsaE [Paracoccus gahaiensis]|uniref:tRNA threonylcarbamoyladenosine biosynthesis protein TsaE n=1 Tax=Paracoccus gahaiensis TaxID=1706839 RepID=A0A4V5MVI6_9RHOB|nr:tRNA (adenosine(37)-N6)-threonylcarbamoyltransferase complex ATPase subunit type 1 TsaE [Paracoccus gahaiensis]TJZ92148.1 tRNA (adenosine(37)-N6)-threonylcarbamoyltransferase complex ATPase subunit type 1 TsaE [Paracoccus gahaiensis]